METAKHLDVCAICGRVIPKGTIFVIAPRTWQKAHLQCLATQRRQQQREKALVPS